MLLPLVTSMLLAASPTPADQRIAEQAILKRADVPRLWTVRKPEDAPALTCPALLTARDAASGVARSRVFENGNTGEAQGAVYVYRDTAAAKRHFRRASSDATMRCYADLLASALPPAGIEVRNVERAPLKVRRVGDQRAATRITFAVTAEGFETEIFADLIFVRVDRGLSLLFGTGVLFPFDDLPRHQLTAKQARRLADALSRRPPARRAARAAVASGG